jgi:phosphomethylpyrimidine synthase
MTQLEEVRKGNVTPALKQVAAEESLKEEEVAELVASGKAVIPLNSRRAEIHPVGIGEKLRTKVNVNIGSSEDFPKVEQVET